MSRLRELFSAKHLPKFCLFVAIYLLGRMEGEGRFHWGDIFASAWSTVATVGAAAADSARGVVGI